MAEAARQKQQARHGWLMAIYECPHCGEHHLKKVKIRGRHVYVAGGGSGPRTEEE
jgi:hypothetical protein